MARRERLEAKLDKRREWAEKAEDRATAAFNRADRISERFAGGQPILVGHHSERGARADQKHIHNAMDKGLEEHALANHHNSKALGLAHQLARNVFGDDADAIERLEVRIAEREQEAAAMVAMNKAWRASKGNVAAFARLGGISEQAAQIIASHIAEAYSWEKQPHPAYELSNLRARINADKKRVEEIKARQARTERAEQSGGVLIEESGEYAMVTFADKPERSILDALRAAGFWWSGGRWNGLKVKLPEGIA